MYKTLSTAALGITAIRESEKIELALTYGFRAMDIDIVEFTDRLKVSDRNHALRLVASAKITLACFPLPVDLDAEEERFQRYLKELGTHAKTAADIQCQRAVAALLPASNELPYHENFDRCRQRLSAIAEILAPHGVRLGLGIKGAAKACTDKSFEFIHDLKALLVLISAVGSDHIGVALDAWDLYASGSNLDEVGSLSPQQIVSVSLADAVANVPREELEETSRLLPGETGVIDSPGLLSRLSEMKYEGPVIPVPHRRRFKGMTRDAIVRMAGSALDKVWKAANLTAAGRPFPTAASSTGSASSGSASTGSASSASGAPSA